MKRIIYFLVVALVALVPLSCSLDEENYTEVEKTKYLNTAEEAETVLLGIYENMTHDGLYGYHLSLYFTLGTDEAKVEGSSITNFRNVPNNAYTSTEATVQTTWAGLYSAIYQANDFLERISSKYEHYNDEDKALAVTYIAEARALRAMFYFELVRWYGNVALITETSQTARHPSNFVQAEPVKVYEFIEKELQYAIENLPYASDDKVRASNAYRFSKGGALGLLVKVYATWAGEPVKDTSKWEEAAKTAKVLVESGKHGLLPDFEKLWKNTANNTWDATESLIEVSFYSATISGNRDNDSSGRIGKWNGVNTAEGATSSGRSAANWKVVPTFADNWRDHLADKRFALSIADYRYTAAGKVALGTATVNGVSTDVTLEMAMDRSNPDSFRRIFNNTLTPAKWDIKKYVTEANVISDANMSNVNWYILRYSDVLLLYAEALNEWKHGPVDDAYTAVNMVRRRAFGYDITAANPTCDLAEGMSYEQFRQVVRDERAHELAFEGHRRQDLIRWGIYHETVMDTYYGLPDWHEEAANYNLMSRYTVKGKNELLPIPQREIDLMPQFKQNPGW